MRPVSGAGVFLEATQAPARRSSPGSRQGPRVQHPPRARSPSEGRPAASGLTRGVQLLDDAADGAHFTLDRELAGDGHVLGERRLRHGRIEREKDCKAGGRSVDVTAADDVNVQIVLRNIRCPLSARRTLVALKTESFAIVPAVSLKRIDPLPCCSGRKRDGLDLDDASQMVQHAETKTLTDLAPRSPFHQACAARAGWPARPRSTSPSVMRGLRFFSALRDGCMR